MKQNDEVVRLALRVLSEITSRRNPAPADIEELEKLAGPKPPEIPLDSWVTEMIQKAIKRQQENT